ncbi:aldehyde dehydrogenase family protein [Arthrobacter sp. D1-29]
MLPSINALDARPETTGSTGTTDARADVARLPGGAFLEGRWQTADLTLEVRDPEDGVLLGRVCTSTPEDVERAIAHIRRHLEAGEWPLRTRRQALEKAVLLLGEQAERFANIIASESSKTITEAEREVRRCAETLRLSAAAAGELAGETLGFEDSMAGAGKIGWYSRKPVGIVAAITPFNDPLNLVAHKLGPALIGGNGVLLKPSTRTPLVGLAFVQLLLEAGVPAGRIAAIVTGPGVSEAVVTDPGVDLISFTGGPATAERIAAAAGAKKILSELGGNNATIICSDANAQAAAKAVVAGAFGVAGQNCLSVQRVYVHTSLFEEVLELVTTGTRALRTGPKLDRGTDVGPLISEAEARRVEEWVEEATAAGATIHAGGTRRGAYYEPTVLTDVPSEARVIRDEVFGPVVSILPFIEVRDAVFAANNTEFGLQTGVFTQSIDLALAIAEKLHVGAVVINETSDVRIDSMPFGGFKKSGVGREGVSHAVREMTEPKNTIINLGQSTARWQVLGGLTERTA